MNKTFAIVVAALLAAGVGYWLYPAGPLPDVRFIASDGQQRSLQALRGEKPRLVVAFVNTGCPASAKTVALLQEQSESPSVAMMAILADGNEKQAEDFRLQHKLSFPVLAWSVTADRAQASELIDRVVDRDRAVYGGSSMLLDAKLKILARFAPDETEKLMKRLGRP